jgi:nucleoside phosphorylase
MIVVSACTPIETAWLRPSVPTRSVRVPMGKSAADGLSSSLDGTERIGLLISAGFSGGLDPHLHTGDIVLADRVLYENDEIEIAEDLLATALRALDRASRSTTVGPFFSSGHVAGTAEEKRTLAAQGAIAVDMESGPLGAWARSHTVPFLAVRTVLDPVGMRVPFRASAPVWKTAVRHPGSTANLAWRAVVAGRSIGRALSAVLTALNEEQK